MAKPLGEPKASAEPKSTRMTRSQAVSKPTVDNKEESGDEVETMDVDIVLEAMKPYIPPATRMPRRRGALIPQETDIVTKAKYDEHKQMEVNENDKGDETKTNTKTANKKKPPVAQMPTSRRTRSQSVLRRTATMDMDESNKSSESEEQPASVKTAEPDPEAEKEDPKPAPRGRGRPKKVTTIDEDVKASEKEAQPKPAKNTRFAAALAAVQSTAGELKETINNLQKRNDKARVGEKEERNKFPYDKMKPRTRFQKSQHPSVKQEENNLDAGISEDLAALELGTKTLGSKTLSKTLITDGQMEKYWATKTLGAKTHSETLSKDEQMEKDNAIFPLLSDSDEAGKDSATYFHDRTRQATIGKQVQAFRDVEGLKEAIGCFDSIRGLIECADLNADDLEEMGKLAEIGMENLKAYLGMVKK